MESHSGASGLGSGHPGRLKQTNKQTKKQWLLLNPLFFFSLKCRINFSDYCPLMILRKTHSSRGTVFPKARVIVAGERRLETPHPPNLLPFPPGEWAGPSSSLHPQKTILKRTHTIASASRRKVKVRISKGRTCPKAGTRSRAGSWSRARWWGALFWKEKEKKAVVYYKCVELGVSRLGLSDSRGIWQLPPRVENQ